MRTVTMTLAVTAGLALSPIPVAAAQASADPWAPWLGCWQREEPASPPDLALRVCVERQGDQIRLRTLAGDTTVLEELLPIREGRHVIEKPGCEGTKQAAWASGRLVLVRSDVTCPGQPRQVVSRVGLLRSPARWLDVVVVEAGGHETVFVRRYERIGSDTARPGLAGDTGTTLTLDGVEYAVSVVSPRAVEVVLAETRPVYKLSGKTLLGLKAAGVPPHLIDLVVALSLPHRFRVSKAARGGGGAGDDAFYDTDWYWGNCGHWDCLGPGVPIYPESPGGPGGGGAAYVHGRVVAGLGYTRVAPVEPGDRDGGRDSSSRSDASSGDSSSGSDRSGSSDSGGVSPQGHSRGDGGDTGRTAEPRGPQE